ncbi:MAG: DUF11 domain-containing protein, partial [Gemmatimonadota bacterium]|nr:DUF11 domain-containing protein [Gemmatimonadota bacterium]
LRYVYGPGPTTYNDLATLNAAIAAALLVQDTTITIEVLYDVAAGTGGQAVSLTFEATSTRDTNVSDDVVTDLTPAESIAVAVAPDSNLAADRLPNSPTVVNYTATFTVTNSGDGPETFDLVGSTDPGGAITIVSVNGGTASIALAATASQGVDVVYTIGDVAAGVIDTLILTATAQTAPNPSDRGHFTYRVVKPSISVAKDVFQADSTSAIVGDSVVPNDVIWYMITVQNTGSAEAQSVQIVDTLPAELTLVSANSRTAGNWTMTTVDTVNGIVVADLNAALPATESRYIWIQAQVK